MRGHAGGGEPEVFWGEEGSDIPGGLLCLWNFLPWVTFDISKAHGPELGGDGECTQGSAVGGRYQRGTLREVPRWAFASHLRVGGMPAGGHGEALGLFRDRHVGRLLSATGCEESFLFLLAVAA